jgi:integral membrane sensor domain MASE1
VANPFANKDPVKQYRRRASAMTLRRWMIACGLAMRSFDQWLALTYYPGASSSGRAQEILTVLVLVAHGRWPCFGDRFEWQD